MKRIRLHRHSDCAKCAKLAKMHHRLDWLDRFEDSAATPPCGPVRMGQIVVQDMSTGIVYGGIECFRLLCRHIPAYWPIIPLTYVPFIRRMIEDDIGGECGGACDMRLDESNSGGE